MATMRSHRARRFPRGTGCTLLTLALAASAAQAETDLGSATISGEAEIGGRIVWGDEDAAKFQEYRDIRDGIIGRFDLLLENEEATHFLRGRGENVGYDDQRYWLEGGRYGRYEIDAFFGELPHIYSTSARTPYIETGGKTFLLNPGFAIAPPPGTSNTFAPVEQDQRWREGSIGGKYHFGESVLARASYRIQDKHGRKNWGMSFGSPGGSFTSIPADISERIHEARAGVDWQLGSTSLSAEYLGNFFQNDYNWVTAQNPNVTGGSPGVIGRAAAAPDNWAQSLSLAGSSALPLGVPNRLSGSFAYGYRYQNASFLPHSLNFQANMNPSLALPASSLEGQVQTILGNLLATVQPAENVSAKLRYRIYDFDNMTDPLRFPGNVRNDGTLRPADPHQSVASSYLRQNGDLDVAWDFAEGWTGVLGMGWEYWHRSSNREVRDLNDYGPTLKVDYRAPGGTLLHAGYEFRNRDGSTYHPLAPIDAVLGPGEVCPGNTAKFCPLRKFDEADRYAHRFDLLATFLPMEPLELTFTGNIDYADYHDSTYGLTEALGWHVGTDAFYQLHSRVGLLGYYTFQWRRSWQDSRLRDVSGGVVTEGPDWSSNTEYQYHNGGVTLRLAVCPEKLDADVGYLINYGQEKTRASGDGAVDLPRVHDRLQSVFATLAWNFSERVTLRAGYRWEDYTIANFRDDFIPPTLTDGSNLYLGDVVGDYTANVFELGATFRF